MSISAAIKTMMEADVQAAVADWSATLAFKGVDVVGTYSPINKGDTMDGDGLVQSSGGEFVAKRSLFAAGIPEQRAVVTIDGVKMCVVSFTDDPACVSMRVERFDDKTSTGGIV